jgi:hypothetical protein
MSSPSIPLLFDSIPHEILTEILKYIKDEYTVCKYIAPVSQKMKQFVTNNNILRRYWCDNLTCKSRDIYSFKHLMDAFENGEDVRRISIDYSIDLNFEKCMQIFNLLLSPTTNVHYFYLSLSCFDKNLLSALKEVIEKNTTIHYFDLRNINDANMAIEIFTSIEQNTSITELAIELWKWKYSLDSEVMQYLCSVLLRNTTIHTLTFYGNSFDDISIFHISNMLKVNQTIKNIYLCDIELTSRNTSQLIKAIRVNSVLENINLIDIPSTSEFQSLMREKPIRVNVLTRE